MMFPSAVQGHMPFVDKYKQEQIKKVIEKHRSRHHSGPDSRNSIDKTAKYKNTHSMPILWQSVYTGQKPKFISMPALDESRLSQMHQQQFKDSKGSKSFLSSLKKFFSGKKDETDYVTSLPRSLHKTTGAIVQGDTGRPFSTHPGSKKPADSDIILNGLKSPKRQRMRTISNISTVMETIEEVNEVLISTDRLSEDSYSSLGAHLDGSGIPENANLFYSCGNLSSHTDSSSSHHEGSSELVCAM